MIKVLVFENASARGSVPMWKGLSLEGEIVRYPSVSLSPTLSRSEKVEQHTRKKTHKPNALRFWVETGVISLCGFSSVLILVRSPRFCLFRFSQHILHLQNRYFTIEKYKYFSLV